MTRKIPVFLFIALALAVVASACSALPGPTQAPTAGEVEKVPFATDGKSLPLPADMPKVEESPDKTLELLNGQKVVFFEDLAKEQYTEEDFAKPGTVTYTAEFPVTETAFLGYGWCAKSVEILSQNLPHMLLRFYLNDQQITTDHFFQFGQEAPDDRVCSTESMVLSGWKPGEYHFRVQATFDEKINDGFSDYEPGDYIIEYDVTAR